MMHNTTSIIQNETKDPTSNSNRSGQGNPYYYLFIVHLTYNIPNMKTVINIPKNKKIITFCIQKWLIQFNRLWQQPEIQFS